MKDSMPAKRGSITPTISVHLDCTACAGSGFVNGDRDYPCHCREAIPCTHEGLKERGPRIAVVHGTFATEICKHCGWWRTTSHKPGEWRAPPVTERADCE